MKFPLRFELEVSWHGLLCAPVVEAIIYDASSEEVVRQRYMSAASAVKWASESIEKCNRLQDEIEAVLVVQELCT